MKSAAVADFAVVVAAAVAAVGFDVVAAVVEAGDMNRCDVKVGAYFFV